MKNTTKTALALGMAAAFAAPLATAGSVSVDVAGIESWDLAGSPFNTVLTVDLAAALGMASGSSVTITGVGWDVVQDSVGASWGSEMQVSYSTSTSVTPDLFLTPSGTNAPVIAEANSSGGILVLADLAIPDLVLADGLLILEFYETYDDIAASVDGIWTSGTLDFETAMAPVPLPAAFPLLLTGLAGLFAARRRRVS